MEFDKFLKDIPGWDTNDNIMTLGKSFSICGETDGFDESLISTRKQVDFWPLQVCSAILTVLSAMSFWCSDIYIYDSEYAIAVNFFRKRSRYSSPSSSSYYLEWHG